MGPCEKPQLRGNCMTNENALDSLETKLRLICDRVRSVAGGYAAGLYLWGEGGTSKSYTVEETLKEVKKPYKLSNSRRTGKGLFTLLGDFPDGIHVLEDVETLFADKNALGPADERGGRGPDEGDCRQ